MCVFESCEDRLEVWNWKLKRNICGKFVLVLVTVVLPGWDFYRFGAYDCTGLVDKVLLLLCNENMLVRLQTRTRIQHARLRYCVLFFQQCCVVPNKLRPV